MWVEVGPRRARRGTRIIHVDPRFTRTSAIADVFVPIRAGTDTAFFGGLVNYVLENELYQEDYVKLHTNASFIVAEGYSFEDGLFSGYDEAKRTYDTATWDYEREGASADAAPPPGLSQGTGPIAQPAFVRVDPTLQDPRSVFQLMREHYAGTPPRSSRRSPASPRTSSSRSPRSSAPPARRTRPAASCTPWGSPTTRPGCR